MSPTKRLDFAEGTPLFPNSYRGLRGAHLASQGRSWAPFGTRYADGSRVQSFYDHYYRTEREHYHASHQDLEKCAELYP